MAKEFNIPKGDELRLICPACESRWTTRECPSECPTCEALVTVRVIRAGKTIA
jgi:rubrerythrin